MKLERSSKRKSTGSLVAELPFALWMLLMLFTVPFIDMATVLLRYTFIVTAARDGVHAAANAKTYFANASGTDLSAVNIASQTVATDAAAFSEISVISVKTYILATNITTHQVTQYTSPLVQPADTGTYLYQLETVVNGQVNPFLQSPILPNIPGLTAPVPVTVASREYCENPQGLSN
jgi:hypothetical protein